jgi:hypothetical protein
MDLAETYRIAMRIADDLTPEVDALASKMVDLIEEEVQHYRKEDNGYMETLEYLALGACVQRLLGVDYAFTLSSLFRSPEEEDE